MKMLFHLLAAILLVLLISPRLVPAGGDIGKSPYDIGEKYFARKEYTTALKHYRKALGLKDARAHYRMGQIFEARGKDQDALDQYRRFMDLGRPEAQQSDATLRIEAIEKRMQRQTTRSPNLLEQGKSLFKKKNYREAERVLLRALAKNKAQPEAHFYLGEVYMALEAYSKAESEYKKAKGSY